MRPILLYCYPIYLSIAENAKKMLQSIKDRALKIISPDKMTTLKMDPLAHAWIKLVSIDVYKSLNDSCPPPLRICLCAFIMEEIREETVLD